MSTDQRQAWNYSMITGKYKKWVGGFEKKPNRTFRYKICNKRNEVLSDCVGHQVRHSWIKMEENGIFPVPLSIGVALQNTADWEANKQQKCISHSPGGWTAKIQRPADLLSMRAHFPVCVWDSGAIWQSSQWPKMSQFEQQYKVVLDYNIKYKYLCINTNVNK